MKPGLCEIANVCARTRGFLVLQGCSEQRRAAGVCSLVCCSDPCLRPVCMTSRLPPHPVSFQSKNVKPRLPKSRKASVDLFFKTMTMTPDDPRLANISLPASAVGFDFHMRQCNISLHVRVHGLAVHPAMVQLCNLGTRVKYSGGVGGAGHVCGTGGQSSTAPLPSC